MNPCNVKPFLTAYVLGDLEPKKAHAIQTHLESCPACREEVEALRKTLSLVKMAFPPAHQHTEKAPVLDPARRMKLLAIKPEVKQNRFLLLMNKASRPLASIAATLFCVLTILGILSAAMFPASSGAMKKARAASKAARERAVLNKELDISYDKADALALPAESMPAPSTPSASPEDPSAPSPEKENVADRSVPAYALPKGSGAPVVEVRKMAKKKGRAAGTVVNEVGATSALEAERAGEEAVMDEVTEKAAAGPKGNYTGTTTTSGGAFKLSGGAASERRRDRYDDGLEVAPAVTPPPAVEPGPFSPKPQGSEPVLITKSPVILKNVYGSPGLGKRENAPGMMGKGGVQTGWAEDADLSGPADTPVPATPPASGNVYSYRALESKTLSDDYVSDEKKQVAAKEDSSRMEPLRIELPKPVFTGTPKDIKTDNLEEPGARRGQLWYYSETAKAKTATASELRKKAERQEEDEAKKGRDQLKSLKLIEASSVEGNVRFKEGEKDKVTKHEPSVQTIDGTTVVSELVTLETMRLKADMSKVGASKIVAGADRGEIERKPAKPREPLPFNPFVMTSAEAFSTFAMDVDTASYTLTRQSLRSGKLPDPERVRLEEIVNAFDYGDKAPEKATFRIYQDGAQSPFGAGYNLLRIGVKGKRLGREEQRPAMLTLVLDVSGSMSQPDRIGYARQSLASLLDNMGGTDRIQIIAYSDQAQLVFEPTPATEKKKIMAAFDRLQCNGSTNLEEGLRRAYEQAVQAFIPGAENRVILISDGVANLGADSAQEILNKVAANRKQGITCSVFGVGAGTYNDQMLEELANKGDGVYRFLDSEEAIKTAFVDDLAATLNTIAKDAKIQVEWNPKTVRRYRQMGYENRKLTKEQFRDDTVDAGEVGSGQSVTALYELELMPDVTKESKLGTVRIRYQRTDNSKVEEISAPLFASTVMKPAHKATPSFKVAASAAEFAELLRNSPNALGGNFEAVADYLRPAALEMTLDTRVKELLELVNTANALSK